MCQVTVDYAKANLEELCDRTEKDPKVVAIVRKNRSYILITQEEWESFVETTELNTASSYNNLAALYPSMGRYEEALPLSQLALAIRKEQLGDR